MPISIERRDFLKLTGAVALGGAARAGAAAAIKRIAIVIDPKDSIACAAPVAWAVGQLRQALTDRGVHSEVLARVPRSRAAERLIVLAAAKSGSMRPESLRIMPRGRAELRVSAVDASGFVYAVLELAERVRFSADESLGLSWAAGVEESPANAVRSVARAFCSEIEDKRWYYDPLFWTGYLSLLAAQRFNRFNLALGFGYDFPRGVTDDYFHFPYPYLLDVPGYQVEVAPLAPGERERNLQMLQYIAAQTAARGLRFQLGIWTHAYAWTDSPNSWHRVSGLNAANHAAYCRDALGLLLRECPQIQGLTLRVHGESGIREGSYAFWETLFEAIAHCGRRVEIDMHAKGINQIMIDLAVKTGMPVKVSAKYAAEHMSLGYHQADIRELEIPRPERMEAGLFNVSNGDRRFTRYGYADLFQEGRQFDVLFRLWPGTQRHLLWGDPQTAAGYARTAHFCGASGLEICEPLTFKGREGSGQAGERCAYQDQRLAPQQDWQKFAYTYRLWGRLLYNPDCEPEAWRRALRPQFGRHTLSAESALAYASRILPLLTSAHLPSASNHSFWPELYENMPIVLGGEPSPYSDTPTPRCFATVSPLDPELFSSIEECAQDLLTGRSSAKYSPIDVARWLEDLSTAAEAANGVDGEPFSAEVARWQEDVRIQVGLGRFFAAKLRSGFAWEIFQRSGAADAAHLAILKYSEAREAWAAMAQRARSVYVTDITYGATPGRRGDWMQRLAAIDRDLAAMRAGLRDARPTSTAFEGDHLAATLAMITARPLRSALPALHEAAGAFRAGEDLAIKLQMKPGAAHAILVYRHINQAERWRRAAMQPVADGFVGEIPAAYTRSSFPLQYYFVVSRADQAAALFPGFNESLANQPYYALAPIQGANRERE